MLVTDVRNHFEDYKQGMNTLIINFSITSTTCKYIASYFHCAWLYITGKEASVVSTYGQNFCWHCEYSNGDFIHHMIIHQIICSMCVYITRCLSKQLLQQLFYLPPKYNGCKYTWTANIHELCPCNHIHNIYNFKMHTHIMM